MIDPEQKFVVTYDHGDEDFHVDPSRPYLKYRNTQIAEATRGMAGIRIVRSNGPCPAEAAQPRGNDVDFMLRYMLRGSMKLRFSGEGDHVVAPGSAWLQPPGMTHALLACSDDAEFLEFAMPGDFHRVDVPATGATAPGGSLEGSSGARCAGNPMTGVAHPFVMTHLRGAEDFSPGRRVNSLSRDLGITAATHGTVTARIGRRHPPVPAVPERRHYHRTQLQIVYLTRGWIRTEFEGQGEITFDPGSCWTQPPMIEHAMRAYSPESFELFEVIVPADFGIIEVDDPVADRLATV